jgi:hypothetical protein
MTPICDVRDCGRRCVHPHPICDGEGWRAFEIDGEHEGRPYTATVLVCPGHTKLVAENRAQFTSFNGGREREPKWTPTPIDVVRA